MEDWKKSIYNQLVERDRRMKPIQDLIEHHNHVISTNNRQAQELLLLAEERDYHLKKSKQAENAVHWREMKTQGELQVLYTKICQELNLVYDNQLELITALLQLTHVN